MWGTGYKHQDCSTSAKMTLNWEQENEWVKGKIHESFEGPKKDGEKKDVFNYIEVFYNRKCSHELFGYLNLVIYEECMK